MTILVTGASGLIGSNLYRRLAEDGRYVIGLVHEILPRNMSSVARSSLTDYDRLDTIISTYKPDTVFHFAAHLPSTANPDYIRVNVIGTNNLLDSCCHNQVKNFIYASSMSVYSTPPEYLPVDEMHPMQPADIYGKTKLIGELLCGCHAQAMKIVTIRFSGVFGSGDNSRVAYRFMWASLSGKPILVDGDGSQSSDFTYVDDAVQGAILALENGKPGEVYNIGSGRETSVLELANLIAGLGDANGEKAEVRFSGRPATRPFRFVTDIGKARRELGYEPGGLVDGLKKYREKLIVEGCL